MRKKYIKFINIICWIFVIFIFYKFFNSLCANSVSVLESAAVAFQGACEDRVSPNSFWHIFLCSGHIYTIFSIVECFLNRYIPQMLHMHQQTFFAVFGGYFLVGMLLLLVTCLYDNFKKYFNKDIAFMPLTVIPLVVIFLNLVNQANASYFVVMCTWALDYFMLPCFGVLLLSFVEKNYVLDENVSIFEKFMKEKSKNSFIFWSLVLCVAVSSESFRFIFLGTIFFIFVIDYFFRKQKIDVKNFSIFYLILVVLNTAVMFSAPYRENGDRMMENGLNYCLENNFIPAYIKYVVVENFPSILMTFLLLFLIYFLFCGNQKSRKNLCIFIVTVMSVNLLFNAVLAFVWQPSFPTFQFLHYGLRLNTKTTFLYCALSCLGFFITNCKDKKIVFWITILFFISHFIGVSKSLFDFSRQYELQNKFKKEYYVIEKYFALYGKYHHEYLMKCKHGNGTGDGILNASTFHNIDADKNFANYKFIYVTQDCDSSDACLENMIKMAKDRANIDFTAEELAHPDFKKLYLLEQNEITKEEFLFGKQI